MTITAVRAVTSPGVADEILDSADVGALIGDGISARTVSIYRRMSRPGGRYAANPFPEPAGKIGGHPYWLPKQISDIRAWDAARPGTGSGATGRPRKSD